MESSVVASAETLEISRAGNRCKDLLSEAERALDAWRYEALRRGSDADVLQALRSFFRCEEDALCSSVSVFTECWELEVELREANISTPFEWRRSLEELKRIKLPDDAWTADNGRWREWIANRGRLAWMMHHDVECWRDYARQYDLI